MGLDALDQRMLSVKGYAKDLLREQIGLDVGEVTAEKYLSGIRHWLKYKSEMGDPPGLTEEDSWEHKENGEVISRGLRLMSREDKKDPTKVMILMGFDPVQWTMIDIKVKSAGWDVTMRMRQGQDVIGHKAKTGDPIQQWLPDETEKKTNYAYNVELRLKPLQDLISTADLRSIYEDLASPEIETYVYSPGDFLLEIGMVDPHLGEVIDGDTTGGASWDLETAVETYKHVIQETLAKTVHYGMELNRIILQVGQDYFNIDNKQMTTTKGTPQISPDGAKKIFRAGVDLMVWTIEVMRREAPVQLVYVPGNHDEILSYSLAVLIDERYQHLDDVTVDLADRTRKYFTYGSNLIGLGHGYRDGARLRDLMQEEAPELWGRSVTREIHVGHKHHEEAMERGGVIIRRLPKIAPRNKWEEEGGYGGGLRRCLSYIWAVDGLEMILPITLK